MSNPLSIRQLLLFFALLIAVPLTFANSFKERADSIAKGRILIVMTNHSQYPSRSDTTGLWFTELTHFYDIARKAGYEMDFVSPKGGKVPLDERSLKSIYLDKAARNYLLDQTFMERLENTLIPDQINASNYQAVYYTGGHGTMWDFPNNNELKQISEQIYQQGGVISAVCHGVAGLLPLQNEEGQPLIAGRKVTGFSNIEEKLSGIKSQVPFLLEDTLKSKGVVYQKSVIPFTSYVIRDDRIITGQNPQSSKNVGEAVIKKLATIE